MSSRTLRIRPPRVLFQEFGPTSLNLLVMYRYHPADYWLYMDFSERVNLAILERFNAEGIGFAFPTQTIHLAGHRNRPARVARATPPE